MSEVLRVVIPGEPQTQGSMYCRCQNGFGVAHYKNARALKQYRDDVRAAIDRHWSGRVRDTLAGAAEVSVVFVISRPLDHTGTGRNAGVLKGWAPFFHTRQKLDLDKLLRALFDALTFAQVVGDDGQIAVVSAEKRYTEEGRSPRTELTVYDLERTDPKGDGANGEEAHV